MTIPDDLLAHIAPLGWEHIALTGDYVWTDSGAIPGFRSLRDVPAAFLPKRLSVRFRANRAMTPEAARGETVGRIELWHPR